VQFQSGGSSFGSASGAVEMYNAMLWFYEPWGIGQNVTKGALTLQGRNLMVLNNDQHLTHTARVTYASISSVNGGEVAIMG